jgi:hypothetical protein
MKLDIESLKREATKHVVFSGSTHATYNDEWVKALARLIVERCAAECDEVSLQAVTAWKLAYQPQDQGREIGADDCAAAIRQLLEDK